MVLQEKLGLVEFDVIWTQIKQRGMCLDISSPQAQAGKLQWTTSTERTMSKSVHLTTSCTPRLGCTLPHRRVHRSLSASTQISMSLLLLAQDHEQVIRLSTHKFKQSGQF